MHIQILGSRDIALPVGWGEETSLSVFSSGHIDATAAPGESAKLTVITFLSSTVVRVPPGSRVQLSGANILSSQSVDVKSSADGPLIVIRAIPVFAGIKIRSG
ncbi:MAG: hypothetical protein U9N84_11205 [Actinomycetota bacterium]|nr:hypothetical protein [Actinomycetota bacterium]